MRGSRAIQAGGAAPRASATTASAAALGSSARVIGLPTTSDVAPAAIAWAGVMTRLGDAGAARLGRVLGGPTPRRVQGRAFGRRLRRPPAGCRARRAERWARTPTRALVGWARAGGASGCEHTRLGLFAGETGPGADG